MKLDSINHLNSALIIISAALAYVFPFELIVFSYAFIGPAHYLTEISWLHDRDYFTQDAREIWLLIALTVPICFLATEDIQAACLWVAFAAAFAMAFIHGKSRRALMIVSLALVGLLLGRFEIKNYFYIFVPTLIHVFVFTGAFILVGGLKSRSNSAYFSLLLFVLAPLILLSFPPAIEAAVPVDRLPFLGILQGQLTEMMPFLSGTKSGVMAFISFAYTYHYLNWFSKTKVIGWHEISKKRAAVIVLAYLASIAFYLWDYGTGYLLLLFLSMLHVILEFPLNHKSFAMIANELRSRLKATT